MYYCTVFGTPHWAGAPQGVGGTPSALMEFVQRVGFSNVLFGLFIARWLVPWEALGLSGEPSNHFFYVARQVTFWLFAAAVVFFSVKEFQQGQPGRSESWSLELEARK